MSPAQLGMPLWLFLPCAKERSGKCNGLWKKNLLDLLISYGGGKEADRIHRQRSLGLKISLAVNFFLVGKGSATFMLLPAAGIHHSCAWQVGQTLSHSEALAGMETTGQRPWVTNSKCWAACLSSLLLYLLPFTFRQPLLPGTTSSHHQGWEEEKNQYNMNLKWRKQKNSHENGCFSLSSCPTKQS